MNFTENKDIFPTPPMLAIKMISKIDWKKANYILEPSAGTGSLLKSIRKSKFRYNNTNLHCIEKDPALRNMLVGAGEKVIGTDFLTYAGLIQFDTIIMNPPFSNGGAHLLKAIDILFSGQIVCLLNAETILNPYTNQRQDLVRKLKELDADIEYIQDAFLDAERKTGVEIALITIKKDKSFEDVFLGAKDKVKEHIHEPIDNEIKDLANSDTIEAIVDSYNNSINLGIKAIHDFYKSTKYVSNLYISVPCVRQEDKNGRGGGGIQGITNSFIEETRKDYWEKVLKLPQFEKRLTKKKREEFRESLKKHADLEFTSDNVRVFFENLLYSYEDTLIDAVEKVFDDMTHKYAYDEGVHNKNVHYYNGWKTNDSFKVNKKVILPRIGIEHSWDGKYKMNWNGRDELSDIDKVMNYFCGKNEYLKIYDSVIKHDMAESIHEIHESEYFKIRMYKKGTTHLTFKSKDILRRFNIEAGRRKGWLPADYGRKPFKELSFEDQGIVESFEDDIKDYDNGIKSIGFTKKDVLMIG